jgi:alpha-1,3-glucosyltransferase
VLLTPQSLLAGEDWNYYQSFTVATVSGVIGLFPLLFKAAGQCSRLCKEITSMTDRKTETPVKFGYAFIWAILVFGTLRQSVSR